MDNTITLLPASIQPLGCPFCDGDVEHPAMAADTVLRMEITCKSCNLTMHEKVDGEGNEDQKDYARFRLLGRWNRRPKVPGADPIPNAVYFDEAKQKFFHGPMGWDMGGEFEQQWLARASEFPKEAARTRGF